MNAVGDVLASSSWKPLLGPQVDGLDWPAALGLAETLLSMQGSRTTLSFFDQRLAFRRLVDRRFRDHTNRWILLRGCRSPGDLLKGILPGNKLSPCFSAGTFVPALLTFLERPRSVGILGDDDARAEALRDYLARHAPWHDVTVVPREEDPARRHELVVVDTVNSAEERRLEPRIQKVHAGLVVMAGSGISALVANTSHRQR